MQLANKIQPFNEDFEECCSEVQVATIGESYGLTKIYHLFGHVKRVVTRDVKKC